MPEPTIYQIDRLAGLSVGTERTITFAGYIDGNGVELEGQTREGGTVAFTGMQVTYTAAGAITSGDEYHVRYTERALVSPPIAVSIERRPDAKGDINDAEQLGTLTEVGSSGDTQSMHDSDVWNFTMPSTGTLEATLESGHPDTQLNVFNAAGSLIAQAIGPGSTLKVANFPAGPGSFGMWGSSTPAEIWAAFSWRLSSLQAASTAVHLTSSSGLQALLNSGTVLPGHEIRLSDALRHVVQWPSTCAGTSAARIMLRGPGGGDWTIAAYDPANPSGGRLDTAPGADWLDLGYLVANGVRNLEASPYGVPEGQQGSMIRLRSKNILFGFTAINCATVNASNQPVDFWSLVACHYGAENVVVSDIYTEGSQSISFGVVIRENATDTNSGAPFNITIDRYLGRNNTNPTDVQIGSQEDEGFGTVEYDPGVTINYMISENHTGTAPLEFKASGCSVNHYSSRGHTGVAYIDRAGSGNSITHAFAEGVYGFDFMGADAVATDIAAKTTEQAFRVHDGYTNKPAGVTQTSPAQYNQHAATVNGNFTFMTLDSGQEGLRLSANFPEPHPDGSSYQAAGNATSDSIIVSQINLALNTYNNGLRFGGYDAGNVHTRNTFVGSTAVPGNVPTPVGSGENETQTGSVIAWEERSHNWLSTARYADKTIPSILYPVHDASLPTGRGTRTVL